MGPCPRPCSNLAGPGRPGHRVEQAALFLHVAAPELLVSCPVSAEVCLCDGHFHVLAGCCQVLAALVGPGGLEERAPGDLVRLGAMGRSHGSFLGRPQPGHSWAGRPQPGHSPAWIQTQPVANPTQPCLRPPCTRTGPPHGPPGASLDTLAAARTRAGRSWTASATPWCVVLPARLTWPARTVPLDCLPARG